MQQQSNHNDLQDFIKFAVSRVEAGSGKSVEDLVRQWRSDTEAAELAADVKQSLIDDALGLSEPWEQVYAEALRRLDIAE